MYQKTSSATKTINIGAVGWLEPKKSLGSQMKQREQGEQQRSEQPVRDVRQIDACSDLREAIKELTGVKKNLKETQARANMLTFENAELSDKINELQQKATRSERKCTEIQSKLEREESKVKEISYLHREIQKSHEETQSEETQECARIKSKKEALQKNYDSLLSKVSKSCEILRQCSSISAPNKNSSQIPHDLVKILNKALENALIVLDGSLQEVKMNNSQDVNIIEELREGYQKACKEAEDFRRQLNITTAELEKEKSLSTEVLPRYRDSLEKLKANSEKLREQIKEEQKTHKESEQKSSRQIQRLSEELENALAEKKYLSNQLEELSDIMQTDQSEATTLLRETANLIKEVTRLKEEVKEQQTIINEQEDLIDEYLQRKPLNSSYNSGVSQLISNPSQQRNRSVQSYEVDEPTSSSIAGEFMNFAAAEAEDDQNLSITESRNSSAYIYSLAQSQQPKLFSFSKQQGQKKSSNNSCDFSRRHQTRQQQQQLTDQNDTESVLNDSYDKLSQSRLSDRQSSQLKEESYKSQYSAFSDISENKGKYAKTSRKVEAQINALDDEINKIQRHLAEELQVFDSEGIDD